MLSHYGSLERIKTYLNITSASDVGAIAQVIYKDATITNSSNYGDVKSSNGCAGGIVGYAAYEAEISNCYNFGTINGTDAGGVVGAFVNSLSSVSIIHLENCINYGRIIATNRAGGLVGRFLFRYHAGVSPAWTTTLCKECGNRGEVEGNYAGGIVGYLENSMENPSFVFDITTMTYDVYLTDCYNLAQITSAQSPGGIIGLIKLSYNAYQTTKVFKAIPGVTLNRCINSADYGLVYNVINSNCYSGSQEKYTINNRRFDYSSSYWLFDIINNRGREYAIGTDTSTNSNWFAQNSHSCTTSSGFDLVSLLGEKWKYASINGRATPVLLFEEE